MGTICGAECSECAFRDRCKGCEATCGRPFGGSCIAAEHIMEHGRKSYESFKAELLAEINTLLEESSLPQAEGLTELAGAAVDLPYPLPNGETARFLDSRNIYLGTMIPAEDGRSVGVAADKGFIIICTCASDGSDPELVLYRKRAEK